MNEEELSELMKMKLTKNAVLVPWYHVTYLHAGKVFFTEQLISGAFDSEKPHVNAKGTPFARLIVSESMRKQYPELPKKIPLKIWDLKENNPEVFKRDRAPLRASQSS